MTKYIILYYRIIGGFKALTTKVINSHLGRILFNLLRFHPLFKMEKTCATQKGSSRTGILHANLLTCIFFLFNVTLIPYCQFEHIFKSYSNLFKRAKCLHANLFQEKIKHPSSLELKIKLLKCFWIYLFLFCVFSSLSTPFLLEYEPQKGNSF